MNYQKLDAALAMAVSEARDAQIRGWIVFIHTEPQLNSSALSILQECGVTGISSGKQLFTATLSITEIDLLSEQTWVKVLRLSQALKLAGK